MLGRTANGLYWMFRYIERAENIARLVDAGLRMSLTRSDAVEDDWDGVLQSAGVRDAYDEGHGQLTGADAIDYLLRDGSNPSSVMSCIEFARNNARMVRTALTRETWEATNECWIDLRALLDKPLKPAEMPETIDAIKRRAGLIRGAFHGSMLRNELYNFARIGTFIERADNTSRILDVKYYVLLPVGLGGRLLPRQCAVGIDPALGLGAPLLQLGLRTPTTAGQYRRLPDPQRTDAALACLLLREDRQPISAISPGNTANALRPTIRRTPSLRRCRTATSRTSWTRACMSSWRTSSRKTTSSAPKFQTVTVSTSE